MRMAINATRHSLPKGLLGFLPVTNGDEDTGLVVGGDGAAEDAALDAVGQSVDGGFGGENARDGA